MNWLRKHFMIPVLVLEIAIFSAVGYYLFGLVPYWNMKAKAEAGVRQATVLTYPAHWTLVDDGIYILDFEPSEKSVDYPECLGVWRSDLRTWLRPLDPDWGRVLICDKGTRVRFALKPDAEKIAMEIAKKCRRDDNIDKFALLDVEIVK